MFLAGFAAVDEGLGLGDRDSFVIITAGSDHGTIDTLNREISVFAPEHAREWSIPTFLPKFAN